VSRDTPTVAGAPRHGKDELGAMILKENLTSLGRLASGVAHEFGNPLTTISSVAQLLRRRRKDDEFVCEQAAVIQAHVARLSRISRLMVDLAFPRRPKISEFDVHATLTDTLQVARLDRRMKKVEVDLDVEEGPLVVRADEGAVNLILLNLLFNAADAMDGEGRITITTTLTDLGVELRISDTGPGIPEEIRSRVFAPFFTTKEAGSGTGLGLSISCRLARACGGELNLGRADGVGANFLLLLSLPEEEA